MLERDETAPLSSEKNKKKIHYKRKEEKIEFVVCLSIMN